MSSVLKNFQKILSKPRNTRYLNRICLKFKHNQAARFSMKESRFKSFHSRKNIKISKYSSSSQNQTDVSNTPHNVIRRTDYLAPPFLVNKIDLDFDIYDGYTIVSNSMIIKNNPKGNIINNSILLNGDSSLQLQSISINGQSCNYEIHNDGSLEIPIESEYYNTSNEIPIEIQTRIIPEDNTSLEGLYKSSSMYCTQCEAEGFRKITYFFDRPDVMCKYTTTIHADSSLCPVLLSNGNIIDSGIDSDNNNRHWIKWFDPFPKPCYLFALVAGNLEYIEDSYTTLTDKRNIQLRIYTESHNIDKCSWAMQSLKQSFKWDEDKYGLEYDLDLFNIVAVDDFNMGAMENKSLNIFNSKYVLASDDTATDTDYHNIQRVIAHEYFHNYTGNRVTCRDWFQLSLKEGLTVYRDQEFSSDYNDRGVERIDQVQTLQSTQFREDAGPMSHPVRPDEYIEINNFYTTTVYEKGAEIIRMIETIIGKENFKNGLNLYLNKHDGEACTIEDFVTSMEEASKPSINLSQMLSSWYSQSGTPEVNINTNYDGDNKVYTIKLKQYCPSTPGHNQLDINKKPFLIPLKLSLLRREMNDNHAQAHELIINCNNKNGPIIRTLLFNEAEQEFKFYHIDNEPLLSINRGYSSPVYIQHPVSMEDLNVLAMKDSDPFNRWYSCNKLLTCAIISDYNNKLNNNNDTVNDDYKLNPFVENVFKRLLQRFVPEKISKELKLEQDANKRKQLLRNKRKEKIDNAIEQQFLMDNNVLMRDNKYLNDFRRDLEDEEFIENLIGSHKNKYDNNKKQLKRNPLLTSKLLCFPSFNYLFGLISDDNSFVDPQILVECIENIKSELGFQLYSQFINCYTWNRDQLSMLSLYPNYNTTYLGWTQAKNYRNLLNISLNYIIKENCNKTYKQYQQSSQILFEQYQLARNMTEMFGSLNALLNSNRNDIQSEISEILQHFYRHFNNDKLVIQKWLRLQSTAYSDKDIINKINNLLQHECFETNNPNFIYSLIGAFVFSNPNGFHQKNGNGYKFLSDQILYYDKINSSVSSRLCRAYENSNKLDKNRKNLVYNELERILRQNTISKGTYEVAKKICDGIN